MTEGRGEVLLEVRGVSFVWRAGAGTCVASARALRGVDLRVRAGEVVAVTGAAGAGKTTLLLCASGLLPLDGGVRVASQAAYVTGTGAWANDVMTHVERGARVLLLDVLDPPALASPRAVAALAGTLANSGLAVVVASRDASALPAFATRLLTLAAGRVVACHAPLDAVLGARHVARDREVVGGWSGETVRVIAGGTARGFVAGGAGIP